MKIYDEYLLYQQQNHVIRQQINQVKTQNQYLGIPIDLWKLFLLTQKYNFNCTKVELPKDKLDLQNDSQDEQIKDVNRRDFLKQLWEQKKNSSNLCDRYQNIEEIFQIMDVVREQQVDVWILLYRDLGQENLYQQFDQYVKQVSLPNVQKYQIDLKDFNQGWQRLLLYLNLIFGIDEEDIDDQLDYEQEFSMLLQDEEGFEQVLKQQLITLQHPFEKEEQERQRKREGYGDIQSFFRKLGKQNGRNLDNKNEFQNTFERGVMKMKGMSIKELVTILESLYKIIERKPEILEDIEVEKHVWQIIEEQKQYLPTDIKKNQLKQVLGYTQDINLADVKRDEILKRQKGQISQGSISYKTMIQRLNWQRVMSKNKNPDFSRKLEWVMNELKKWWESKKTTKI